MLFPKMYLSFSTMVKFRQYELSTRSAKNLTGQALLCLILPVIFSVGIVTLVWYKNTENTISLASGLVYD
jgi:hypothetical protein